MATASASAATPVLSAFTKIANHAAQKCSLLCVGLDPDEATVHLFARRYPDDCRGAATFVQLAERFCMRLIRQTRDYACAFKPNSAFFEAMGPEGVAMLKRVCDYIHENDIPIILDVKRGDIGSTAKAYAKAAFDIFHATLVIANPYLGRDSLAPFLDDRPETGVLALCKTSNPGADDFQELRVTGGEEQDTPFYQAVAKLLLNESHPASSPERPPRGEIGLVVGATQEDALRNIRQAHPDVWILAPGVGAQGADPSICIPAGIRQDGLGLILPMSRIIATAEKPGDAARQWRDDINQYRYEALQSKPSA